MKVISVNIGSQAEIPWKGKIYTTGIIKSSVPGPIFLDREGVKNDSVIDRKYHGGADQAVYAYGYNHYSFWEKQYPLLKLDHGFFGENLSLSDIDEKNIFVGDIYELGEAVLQVTKPRQPCLKLGIRFNDTAVIKQFWNTTMSGVYFKVLQSGKVAVEDELKLIEKAQDAPSIAEVFMSKK